MAELDVLKKVKLNDLTYVVMQDERLSWEAKGVYAYIQDQVERPAYSFAIKDVLDSSPDDEKTVLNAVAELTKYHYLQTSEDSETNNLF